MSDSRSARLSSSLGGLVLTALSTLLGVAACGNGENAAGRGSISESTAALAPLDSIDVGAQPGSTWPSLATDDDGHMVLSWLEALPVADTVGSGERKTGQSRYRIRVSQLETGRWTAPRTIAENVDFFINWADFPTVAPMGGDRLVAWWPENRPKADGGGYAYDAMISTSLDRGTTWSKPVQVHRDRTATEHGFVSFIPLGARGDSIGAIWLDGRDYARPATPADDQEMQLAAASISVDGRPGSERMLDNAVCTCCRTSAARTRRGVIVTYRDRKPGELRDIAVVRYENGAWSAPATLHEDGWIFPGCPVNGAVAAAHGDTVAVAWFTAPRDSARVNVVFSTDGGRTFGTPMRVDEGFPAGRVGIVVDRSGTATVTWIERVAPTARKVAWRAAERAAKGAPVGGSELRARRVTLDGARGPSQTLSISTSGQSSGFPQIAALGDTVYLAWTDPPEGSRPSHIRVVRTTLARPAL